MHFKVTTPNRGRLIENRRNLSTKDSLKPLSSNKRTSSNLTIKDNSENLFKLIPPTCDEKAYTIGPIIGKGSYAIVKMGTDKNGNKVAIKMYDKSLLHGERLNNLVKEISILRQLNHDQIVKIYNVYHSGNYLNIVLEYCGTESLYMMVKSKTYLPKETALHLLQ